jgi:GTPase SAR1 family protein
MFSPSGTSDQYKCFLTLNNRELLIGTKDGKVIKRRLKDEIMDLGFNSSSENIYYSVLEEEPRILFKVDGKIRSIKKLDSNNILILSHLGGIFRYDTTLDIYVTINEESKNSYDRMWNLIIIDENNFITTGSRGSIYLWIYDGGNFESKTYKISEHSFFCINWINKKHHKLLVNNYRGESFIISINGNELIEEKNFRMTSNLQDFIIYEDYLISVNYYGKISIYTFQETTPQEVMNFELDSSQGNNVMRSKETGEILIGTGRKLIMIDKNFQEVLELDIGIEQIIHYGDIELFLTESDLVRINFEKATPPIEISDYKYKKFGLVGDSQTGKTSFCRFLGTGIGEAEASSRGTHVWSISLEEEEGLFSDPIHDRRILYFDLAGQETEHFTYFPKIYDSDVILLFYHAERADTFTNAIAYYEELREYNKHAKFFFIQTHSDAGQRVLLRTIEREFDRVGVNFNTQLIKLDNKSGNGFDQYKQRIIDNLEWEATPITFRLPIYDKVEGIIHSFYLDESEVQISVKELSELVKLDEKRLDKILRSFYDQGYFDYLINKGVVLINHQGYTNMSSMVANLIAQEGGFASTALIYNNLVKDANDVIFINNILTYYRNNNICLIFKEGEIAFETLIFKRKLHESFRADILQRYPIPNNLTKLEYKNYFINISELILFLNHLHLSLLSICKKKVLLQTNEADGAFLYIEINKKIGSNGILSCSFGLNKNNTVLSTDIIEKITRFFWTLLEDNLINLSVEESYPVVENSQEEGKIILKRILNHPCERPYLDFKKEIDLGSNLRVAEYLKDIIALTNSAYFSKGLGLLAVGIVEKDCEITSFQGIEDISNLEQRTSQIIEQYLNFGPNLEFVPININTLFEWQIAGDIPITIPFKEEHKNTENQDQIVLIIFKRINYRVCDLKKEILFQKHNKTKKYYPGMSWIRLSSHTYSLSEPKRMILREENSSFL